MALTRLGTKAVENSLTNITDQGTEGTKVATGTTAQRGSTQGQTRYNTDNKSLEVFNGSTFDELTPSPTLSSASPSTIDTVGTKTFTITGTNFKTGDVISFVATDGTSFNAITTSVTSNSSITATASGSSFSTGVDPYDIKITSNAGQTAQLTNYLSVDTAPTWNTTSGNIADINDIDTGTHVTVSATDADGDTITYALESGSSLPGGLSLDSSTGAISGDPTDVASDTTTSFTLEAQTTAATTTRSFNIIVRKSLDGSTEARAAPSALYLRDELNLGVASSSNDGTYWIKPSGQSTAYQLYCILDTRWDGGGWTKIGQIAAGSNFTASQTSWTNQSNYNQNRSDPSNNSCLPTDFCKALHISTNIGGGERILAGHQTSGSGNPYWLALKGGGDGILDEIWDTTCFRGGTQSGSGSGFSTENYVTGFTDPTVSTSYGATSARTYSAAVVIGLWDTKWIKSRNGAHPNANGMNLDNSNSDPTNHNGNFFVR